MIGTFDKRNPSVNKMSFYNLLKGDDACGYGLFDPDSDICCRIRFSDEHKINEEIIQEQSEAIVEICQDLDTIQLICRDLSELVQFQRGGIKNIYEKTEKVSHHASQGVCELRTSGSVDSRSCCLEWFRG